MKICMISHAFPPEKLGGAEVYARRISRALARQGHKVIVITQRPFAGVSSLFPRAETRDGLVFYRFYPWNIFSIYSAQKRPAALKALWRLIDLVNPIPALCACRILRKERPDIVHAHITHGFSALILLRLIKKLRIPLVQTIHSYGLFCLRCDLLRPSGKLCRRLPLFCRAFAKIAGAIANKAVYLAISPSQFCLAQHLNNGLFTYIKKAVLPNPVEMPESMPQKRPQGVFSVLFAGRLTKNKGAHILIEAFQMLAAPQARLIIAGEGPRGNKLRRQAKNDPRISFVGKLAEQGLFALYARSSITVVPSLYYEPFGNVIIESFAAGTPVLASRIGGMPEIAQDGFNGHLFTPGKVDELKALLERLMREPEQLKILGKNAFACAQNYSLEKHVAALEKIYLGAKDVYPGS
jgi:glycosyltransferase involved in cell wall biosynthesis